MHFSDSIKIITRTTNTEYFQQEGTVFWQGGDTEAVWEGEGLASDHWDKSLSADKWPRPMSCSTLAQTQQCQGDLALPPLCCRGWGSSLAQKVWKHWEIQIFLISQLSSMLPKCGIKKERGEITLQIKQERFLIHLYGMYWHKCSYNLKSSKSRFNGRDFQGSVSLPVPSVHAQSAVGWFPTGTSKSKHLFSFLTSKFLFPLSNWFHLLKTDISD